MSDSNTIGGTIVNETIEQGATWSRTYELFDASDVALDVRSYTATMMIKPTYDATSAQIVGYYTSNPSSGIVVGSTDGKVLVTIPATATSSMGYGAAVYDVEMTRSDGFVLRLVSGSMKISRRVSRP